MSGVDNIEELLFVSIEGTFRGYRKCIVISFVSEDLFCQECEGVLREPCVVAGSNLCTTCSGHNATLCNSQLTEVVNQLKCKCPLNTRGCKWLGELCDLIGHIEICGYVKLKCALGCQSILIRECMTEHIESGCPHSPVDCPFSSVGCKVTKLCRGNVCRHMESSVMTHQSLLLSAIVGMRETSLNNRDLIFRHGRTIKQHDETVKQNQNSILQHEQTISGNIQAIKQHSNSIVDHRETMFSNRDSMMRYRHNLEELNTKIEQQNETIQQQSDKIEQQNGTIQQQSDKIEQQNGTIDQLFQTIATQNETIEQQNGTIQQQGKKIEVQNTTIQKFNKTLTNKHDILFNQCEFIRSAFFNKFIHNMDWNISQFSLHSRHFGPKIKVGDISMRGMMSNEPNTNKLNISVERVEFAVFADPQVSIVYWKIEIVNNHISGDNLVQQDQSGNIIPLVCGRSQFLAQVKRDYLISGNYLKDDNLTLKFSFIFV